MEIKKEQNGLNLTIMLEGRLDATTAPQLDKEINSSLEGITNLIFDFSKLVYIASAGLRTLLVAQKRMKNQGSMKIINVSKDVNNVLEMTGFVDFLTIEN